MEGRESWTILPLHHTSYTTLHMYHTGFIRKHLAHLTRCGAPLAHHMTLHCPVHQPPSPGKRVTVYDASRVRESVDAKLKCGIVSERPRFMPLGTKSPSVTGRARGWRVAAITPHHGIEGGAVGRWEEGVLSYHVLRIKVRRPPGVLMTELASRLVRREFRRVVVGYSAPWLVVTAVHGVYEVVCYDWSNDATGKVRDGRQTARRNRRSKDPSMSC